MADTFDFKKIPEEVFRNGTWIDYMGDAYEFADSNQLENIFNQYYQYTENVANRLRKENTSKELLDYVTASAEFNKSVDDFLKGLGNSPDVLKQRKENLDYSIKNYSSITKIVALGRAIKMQAIEIFGKAGRDIRIKELKGEIKNAQQLAKKKLREYKKTKSKFDKKNLKKLNKINKYNRKKGLSPVTEISYTATREGILLNCQLGDLKAIAEKIEFYENRINQLNKETLNRKAYIQANYDIFRNKSKKNPVQENVYKNGLLNEMQKETYLSYKKQNPELFIPMKELARIPEEKLELILEITTRMDKENWCVDMLAQLKEAQLREIEKNLNKSKEMEVLDTIKVLAKPENSEMTFSEAFAIRKELKGVLDFNELESENIDDVELDYENLDDIELEDEDLDDIELEDEEVDYEEINPDMNKIVTELSFLIQSGEVISFEKDNDKFIVQKNYNGEIEISQTGLDTPLTVYQIESSLKQEIIGLYEDLRKERSLEREEEPLFEENSNDVTKKMNSNMESKEIKSDVVLSDSDKVQIAGSKLQVQTDREIEQKDNIVIGDENTDGPMSFDELTKKAMEKAKEREIETIYEQVRNIVKDTNGVQFRNADKDIILKMNGNRLNIEKYNSELEKYEKVSKDEFKQIISKNKNEFSSFVTEHKEKVEIENTER